MGFKKVFSIISRSLLDLIYPSAERCLYCNRSYKRTEIEGLCSDCLQKIEFVKSYCAVCGRALTTADKRICIKCSSTVPFYSQARSIACYQGLYRRLILGFKYYHRFDFKSILLELLALYYDYYYQKKEINYIIPIPLHKNRFKERGFNQTSLLGRELAKKIKKPLITNFLQRIKNTPPLYSYAEKERKEFLKNCFTVNYETHLLKKSLKNSSILLIDDIFTTGSTANEASFVLKKSAGVKSVYVLTLATAKIS